MTTIDGLTNLQEIHHGNRIRIFKATNISDGSSIICKIPTQEHPANDTTGKLREEYRILQTLQEVQGVPEAFSLQQHENREFLLEEFCPGVTLDKLKRNELSLSLQIEIMLSITEILERVHSRHIIHADIKPQNIIYDISNKCSFLIDFGNALQLSSKIPVNAGEFLPEGSLAYIAPEQTGRIRNCLDYRSDLYSLGAAFYHLLSGHPPFVTNDPLEMLHCHLAITPTALDQVDYEIPVVLSSIVSKLLSKDPDMRYQSASGLKYDLSQCLESMNKHGKISEFSLGTTDFPEFLRLTSHLYGRESDLNKLRDAFNKTKTGQNIYCSIAGYSGVGKTRLTEEFINTSTNNDTYFMKGKFDRLKLNIPYSALREAFQMLAQSILSENLEIITTFQDTLHEQLEDSGSIICRNFPELSFLFDLSENEIEIQGNEEKNRFHYVIARFLDILASARHYSIVLFLDDLQWADSASLDLISALMVQTRHTSLLFIGSYRDNEVSNGHPLFLSIDEIRSSGIPTIDIRLQGIDISAATSLISDLLFTAGKDISPLAELLMKKTAGNPYYMLDMIRYLYRENIITIKTSGSRKSWEWDLNAIQKATVSENVADLIVESFSNFPADKLSILKWASLVGNSFSLQDILTITTLNLRQTAKYLIEMISDGIIILKNNNDYRKLNLAVFQHDKAISNNDFSPCFLFTHDKIQEAIENIIPEKDKINMHHIIGKHMLKIPEMLLTAAAHLNQSINLMSAEEKIELGYLNINAAYHARRCMAYNQACSFASLAIHILGDIIWTDNYQRAVDIHTLACETSYLTGNWNSLDYFRGKINEHAVIPLDKAPSIRVYIQSLTLQGLPGDAINIGLAFLREIGVDIPDTFESSTFLAWNEDISGKVKKIGIKNLASLPAMQDKSAIIAMKIMAVMASPAHIARPDLFPALILKQLDLSLRYGNAQESSVGYCLYGMLLCAALHDIPTGYKFGMLALKILDKLNVWEYRAMVLQLVAIAERHWIESLHTILPSLKQAHRIGLESGDLPYAGFSGLQVGIHAYFSGISLAETSDICSYYSASLESIRQNTALNWNRIYEQVIACLRGKTNNPCRIEGVFFSEDEKIPEFAAVSDTSGLANIYIHKMILNFIFRQKEDALASSLEAEKYLNGVMGFLMMPVFHFYRALSILALIDMDYSDASKKNSNLELVKEDEKKLKTWGHYSPGNYLHKYYLVHAELARHQKKKDQAGYYYDLAIKTANEKKYIQEEALANELAGRFYLGQDRGRIGGVYIQQAFELYSRWGATAKCSSMKHEFNDILSTIQSAETAECNQPLDYLTLIKATQVISSEIVLDKLAIKLLQISSENIGAERGILILKSGDRFTITAECSASSSGNILAPPIELELASDILPISIIQYIAKTSEHVLFGEKNTGTIFAHDPYFEKKKPKSLLALPLASRSNIIGITYFENDLMTGCFTREHVEFLSILSAQAGISIENAMFYSGLEEKISERTTSLLHANKKLTKEITHRQKIEAELRESKELFDTFMERLPAAVFIKDMSFNTIYANHYFENLFGSNWKDKTAIEIFSQQEGENMLKDDKLVLEGKIIEKIEEVQDISGQSLSFQTVKFPLLREDHSTLIGGFGLDITERVEMEKALSESKTKLETLAITDEMTGVFNRRMAFTILEKEISAVLRSRRKLAISYLDVDGLKSVNDQYGHPEGDRLLKKIVEVIAGFIRIEDNLCRIGGDEFIIILPDCSYKSAQTIMQRIRRVLGKINNSGSYPYFIDFSYGIEEFDPVLHKEPGDFILQADHKMYKQKKDKRNQI